MRRISTFIDRYALIIAMLIGAVGYPWFRHLSWLMPPLICLMLFFTFCKINPLDLRLRKWHGIVLAVQMVLTAVVYYGLMAIGKRLLAMGYGLTEGDIALVAQGLMVCVIMPTATAAPIIAGKLGGSIQNLTTFSLVSNIATAVIVPAFFPLINTESGMEFLPAMWMILRRVSPMLLGPFIAAWLLRLSYEWYYRRKGTPRTFTLNARWASMPFYLWILLLIVLISQITYTLLTQEYSGWAIVALCVGSLVACLLQFMLGRWIGYRFPATSHGADYQDILINPAAAAYSIEQKSRITAGQAFGQKNTALGIWMAQMYLHPLSSIGPAAYIIWQNLLNSYQLWNAGRGVRKTSPTK
ncbi:MAG: transporter [Paludibacteraceae bacterium]|nr:transporter [Paludibacteraceae bacterium]